MSKRYDYVKDGAEIYRLSFGTIEAEADLDRLPPLMRPVATRMIHASGQIDLQDDLAFSDGFADSARRALQGRRTHPLRCADGGVSGIISLPAPWQRDRLSSRRSRTG